jgi:hypothetical protein
MVECKIFAHSAFMFVGQEENADVCKEGDLLFFSSLFVLDSVY